MTSTHGHITIDNDRPHDRLHDRLKALGAAVTGEVLTPAHPGFDEARHIFSRHLDRMPAVIVRPRDADDVAEAIAMARESDLEIAVRSGGHSGAGHGTVDGGLVLDLRDLDSIDIDVASRTAWVGGGATAAAVTKAVGAHGLAIGFGDTGSVGVGGITLGGGHGFLSRVHGLTIDNVLAVELVTADGRVVVADDENHPELFWALRGGGGNFGVATRFQYQLRELPVVYGGMLMLPATTDTLTRVMELSLAAPDELTLLASVMPAPPMPFVPEEHHGAMIIMLLVTYAGPAAQGEPVLAPFRAVATPLADMVREMPYAEMFQPQPEGYHPIALSRNGFARGFDRSTAQHIIETLVARSESPDVQMAAVQLRLCGGAIARVDALDTAYAHRQWPLMFNVATVVSSVDALAAQEPWVEALAATVSDGTPGAYVAFVGDEGPDRIHDIYPSETAGRLARVKRTWDPDNVFHRNQNVLPA